MNKCNKIVTDLQNKLVVTGGEREGWKGKIRVGDYEAQTIMYKINKLQRYVIQHREYSQYFIIMLNVVKSIKILNHYATHLNLI